MSELNVLPSALAYVEQSGLYPVLQGHKSLQMSQDFRLGKVNEIAAKLADEVVHYRLVRKKFKRAKTVVNWISGGLGGLSAVFSSAGLASALSGVGILVAAPLGAVGGFFSVASSSLIIVGKKLDKKMSKHQEIVTLALAKRASVDRLVSKAINDKRLSDSEFQNIISELEQYNALKEKVRAKLTKRPSVPKLPQVDVEKIKREARAQAETEFQKKLQKIVASSN